MKRLFFVLFAANAALLAWLMLGSGGRSGETMRGHEPLQAEKLAPLNEAQIKKLVAEAAPPPEAPAPANEPPPAAPPPGRCLEWGEFSGSDLERARRALQKLQLADKAVVHKVEKVSGYWVYVPPRPSLEEAQKKAEEIKRRGVEELFILQENTQWRHAISLGVFSTEEAAGKYLAQLHEKGVRSAVAGPRTRETDMAALFIKGVDEGAAASLTKLKAQFPSAVVKTVSCK